jgi:hypothetical protein
MLILLNSAGLSEHMEVKHNAFSFVVQCLDMCIGESAMLFQVMEMIFQEERKVVFDRR